MTLAPRTVPLQSLCTFRGGGTPNRKNEEYFGGRILWISPKDMKSWEITDSKVRLTKAGLTNGAAKLIPANSVLVVIRSGVLKHQFPVAINRVPVTVNQDIKALVCKDGVSPDYMARFLKWKSPQVLGWVRGTTADNIPVDRLKTLEVPLPSLAEQRRIAAMLDKADAVRRKRREAIGLLDEFLRSAFLEMFGDPVTNPKGWEVVRLGEVGVVQGGLQVTSRRDRYPLRVPYLRVANVYRDKLELSEIKEIGATDAEVERVRLSTGDILVVEGHGNPSEIGRSAVWDGSIDPCVHQNHLIRVRIDRSVAHSIYVSAYLNSSGGRRHMLRVGKTTSGLNTISTSNVRAVRLLLPPVRQQTLFVELRDRVLHSKSMIKRAQADSDTLFNSLAQRAFGGEG